MAVVRPGSGRGRLSRSADFDQVFRKGRSRANSFLVLYAFARDDQGIGGVVARPPRLGLSVSRRVGGAVVRSRVKRVLRESFWAEADRLPAECDYVIVARPPTAALVERDGARGAREQLAELIAGLNLPASSREK